MEPNHQHASASDHDIMQEHKLARSINYKKKPSSWMEMTKFAIIVLFIVIPLRLYVVQPFIVSGQSMEYNFETGQYLLVDELSYRWSNPERGDVIVFRYPNDTKKYYIKRIIGLPGDIVDVNFNKVTIKNKENPNGIVLRDDFISPLLINVVPPDLTKMTQDDKKNLQTVSLADNQYFVMGDNRLHSSDSRSWGTLDKKFIVGRPIVRLIELNPPGASSWFPIKFTPFKDIGLYPGEHREIDEPTLISGGPK